MGDEATRAKILKSDNPEEVKALGRQVENFDANKWNCEKIDVVLKGNLHKFLANVAKEGDILFVPELTDLYSNVRELCCLMHDVERTGIVIKSSDMDLSDDSTASNWIIASQLARLDYAHYLHSKCLVKASKKEIGRASCRERV